MRDQPQRRLHMINSTPEKHILPDASYGTILGVLERMADVAGIAPKKRITDGRQNKEAMDTRRKHR